VLSLLHPDPDSRPTVDDLVRSEPLLALHLSIRSRHHSAGAPHRRRSSSKAPRLRIASATAEFFIAFVEASLSAVCWKWWLTAS
jgi:hypothetical protein